MDKLTGISEPTVTLPIGMDCRVYKFPAIKPSAALQRFCLLTGTAFTGKDGFKYGDHSVFDGGK